MSQPFQLDAQGKGSPQVPQCTPGHAGEWQAQPWQGGLSRAVAWKAQALDSKVKEITELPSPA